MKDVGKIADKEEKKLVLGLDLGWGVGVGDWDFFFFLMDGISMGKMGIL